MRNFTAGCVPVLLSLIAPQNLAGQERPDSVQARNDCRLAHQVLVHGQPANKRDWALTVVDDCGPEGADAIAHVLRTQRIATTRSAGLDQLANAASMIVDAEVFRAALEVAADETAGEAARVHAIGIVNTQITRSVLPYEALVTDPRTGRLFVGDVTTWQPLAVRELPADARAAAVATLSRLMTESQSPVIRLAAEQVFYHICEAQ